MTPSKQGTDLILARLDRCQQLLRECRTAEQAKRIAAVAEAARVYAKRVGAGVKVVNLATTYRLRAERRLGEILKSTEKAKGGEQYKSRPTGSALEPVPTLAEAGIPKKVSARAQRLATVPAETFEAKMVQAETSGKEVSAIGLFAKEIYAAQRTEKIAVPLPAGKFRVLYADPPWSYAQSLDKFGPALRHYPCLTIEELCGLRVADLAADDAVLFLWTTSPMLEESFKVIHAWGFEYRGASFVWDKVKHNFGHYNSVRHEFLLVCVRGSYLPETSKLYDSVVSIERTKHSEKPPEFRAMIEGMYPTGPRVELFARSKHEGWVSWGHEADSYAEPAMAGARGDAAMQETR